MTQDDVRQQEPVLVLNCKIAAEYPTWARMVNELEKDYGTLREDLLRRQGRIYIYQDEEVEGASPAKA